MERCYQFAEHYFRVMRAANAPGPERKGISHARASDDRLPKENANPEKDPGWRLGTTHKAATGRKPLVTSTQGKRH